MGGISLAGSQKVAGAQQRVRGLASAGAPGDLCSALCFGPWDLYLTLSFLDFKNIILKTKLPAAGRGASLTKMTREQEPDLDYRLKSGSAKLGLAPHDQRALRFFLLG